MSKLPHSVTVAAYQAAKSVALDELDSWWAAFAASPETAHERMYQDACAAAGYDPQLVAAAEAPAPASAEPPLYLIPQPGERCPAGYVALTTMRGSIWTRADVAAAVAQRWAVDPADTR